MNKLKNHACGIAALALAATCAFAGDREWEGYRLVERGEPKSVEGLENPDFELVSKYGKWPGRDAEIGRYGYNGNGGIRIWPRGKTTVFTFPFKGRLEKGREYRFIGSFKRHGKLHCSYIWESYLKGKYLKGQWNVSYGNLEDGWQTCEYVFSPSTDDPAVEHRFFLYITVPKDSKPETFDDTYVDCDNLTLTEATPSWKICNTWPMHNAVYNEEGRVRFYSSFVGEFFEPNAKPFYRVELLDASGRRLAEKLCRDDNGVFTAALGKIDYSGAGRLAVHLYDRANRIAYGSREIEVDVGPTFVPAKNRAFIDEKGRVLVNGRPFMPIGFWSGFAYPDKWPLDALDREMKKYSEAGFNAICEYGGYAIVRNDKHRDAFFGILEKYGIKYIGGEFLFNGGRFKQEIVDKYKNYPAIISWLLSEEVNEDKVPLLAAHRRAVNKAMPGILACNCNIFAPDVFLPGNELLFGDFYPYHNPESVLKGCDTSLKRIEDCHGAASWSSPQCYNWNWKLRGKPGFTKERFMDGEPNEEQKLAVALLMVQRSITGFFFYSYLDMLRFPDGLEGLESLPAERWEHMKRIAKVLKDLEPFIMSGQGIEEIPVENAKDEARVVALSDGRGGRRVIAVGLGLDHSTSFTLPKGFGKPKSLRGRVVEKDGKCVFTGPNFACDVLECGAGQVKKSR